MTASTLTGCELNPEEFLPRRIRFLVVHCTATRSNCSFSEADLLRCHRSRGFHSIGYHLYITRDGVIHHTRPFSQIGAHAAGFNLHSIGICYEGGLTPDGVPADTRTPRQRDALYRALTVLKDMFPDAEIVGHYQLSAAMVKACPCFDARREYEGI